jgi:putative thioredoxin
MGSDRRFSDGANQPVLECDPHDAIANTGNIMESLISVNKENFATEVLQRSHEKPVLVDFFAQWCGPCKLLKPMLEKLAQEYDFVLATVDIDENSQLAQEYHVEGVPDVRIAVNGAVTDGFVGMLPEPKLREFLAHLTLRFTLDDALEAIYAEASADNMDQARSLLHTLLQTYPDSNQVILEAAHFYTQADELEQAEALLARVQESDKDAFAYAKQLKAQLGFKQIAKQPVGENPLDPAFQEAAALVIREDYDAALEILLGLVSRDRRYREDGARKAMVAIFDLLGDENPLTKTYRKQLVMALY